MECYASDQENPITHVIFDVDGTILDTEAVYNEAKQKVNNDKFALFYFNFCFNKLQGHSKAKTNKYLLTIPIIFALLILQYLVLQYFCMKGFGKIWS